ncbi:hypothetical protein CPB84DRAFT_1846138 [Gymnopilus junonius]|uniref:Uncharacterized protein n=1 Tax=Gymnopilus junonius TaxID=109634 RepID=A0A9P5TNG8_GYMJU|nr:hypothetical protein CPB84DRAFT_1846138 [Gymnopilus junonius]
MESPATPSASSSTTPPQPVEPKIDYTLTDKVLGLSEVVLAGLAAATGFIPVPFIADAIKFAAKLIEMANDVKRNIGMCKDLAYNACNIAYCAFRKCEDLVGKKGTDPEGHCSISAQLRDQLQHS